MSKRILIINGPNLNLVGTRQPEIYGNLSMDTFIKELREKNKPHEIAYYQSNIEGELINKIQLCSTNYHGLVINAGAYTHTSIAIGDALASAGLPCIEVHISNIAARESFRHTSFLTPHCKGLIMGFGLAGYQMAVHFLISQ
ncbi:MAG: type II 3-dehydroquinate dehydratase [Bacteroidetes bacterium]|nr:type II 3-dehydroquinate dehydratase [Bacteroidota bacterium]